MTRCLWHRLKGNDCNARKLLHQQNLSPQQHSQLQALHVGTVITAVVPMLPPISNTVSPVTHAEASEMVYVVP